MKRYAPIPLIQAGGIQPYLKQQGGQMPGDALMAMLRGATFGGQNPMDAKRALQRAGNNRPMTLLDTLRG